MKRKIDTRRTVYDDYKGLGTETEGGFVEVTEWTNGNGVDIYIDSGHSQERMSVEYETFKQIEQLIDILLE